LKFQKEPSGEQTPGMEIESVEFRGGAAFVRDHLQPPTT
jgi:hypothetical protein